MDLLFKRFKEKLELDFGQPNTPLCSVMADVSGLGALGDGDKDGVSLSLERSTSPGQAQHSPEQHSSEQKTVERAADVLTSRPPDPLKETVPAAVKHKRLVDSRSKW
jgi:hypothetical protein